jgi:hypothetical protein
MRDHTEVANEAAPIVFRARGPVDDDERTSDDTGRGRLPWQFEEVDR